MVPFKFLEGCHLKEVKTTGHIGKWIKLQECRFRQDTREKKPLPNFSCLRVNHLSRKKKQIPIHKMRSNKCKNIH